MRYAQCYSAAMMTLADYLESTGETVSAFAERVRLSRVSVSRIKGGRQRPSWDAAQRIAIATGGRVPVESWAKPDEAA